MLTAMPSTDTLAAMVCCSCLRAAVAQSPDPLIERLPLIRALRISAHRYASHVLVPPALAKAAVKAAAEAGKDADEVAGSVGSFRLRCDLLLPGCTIEFYNNCNLAVTDANNVTGSVDSFRLRGCFLLPDVNTQPQLHFQFSCSMCDQSALRCTETLAVSCSCCHVPAERWRSKVPAGTRAAQICCIESASK